MQKHMTKEEYRQLEKKLTIAAERCNIADYLEKEADDILLDITSKAVDGYVAAIIRKLANAIREGKYDGYQI